MLPILLLVVSLIVLTAIFARAPRRAEGLLIAYLMPCLAFFAYVTWHNKTAELNHTGVNINTATPAEIAQATGIHLELAELLTEYRETNGRYSSLSSIPTLGSASIADRKDIRQLSEKKDWKTLGEIANTGKIPDSARPGLIKGVVRAANPGQKQSSGLLPEMDLRARAIQAQPDPEIDLAKSPREILLGVLGNEAVVDRIIQFRRTEWRPAPGEVLRISDIPAVPKDKIVLRTKEEATQLFWLVIFLLIGFVIGLHVHLKRRNSTADEFLLPLMGALGVLSVIMLFSVSSPLKVPAAVPGIPLLFGSAQPKYIGQALAVFLGLALLPFAYRGVRFIERSATMEVLALAALGPLAANVFASSGAGSIPAILICGALIAAGLYRMERRKSAQYTAVGTIVIALLAIGRILAGRSGYAPFFEFGKIALIIYTARLCAEHDFFFGGKLKQLPSSAVVHFVSVWLVAILLTLLVKDMGVLLLLWVPCILLIGFAFSRREVLAGLAMLLIGAKIVQLLSLGPFQDRVAMWLNPWTYIPTSGYAFSSQMAQALHRIASVPSPIAGMGLGRGTLASIATDTQDVILPLYFEQLGFIGVALVVLIYLVIMHRLFRIGVHAQDRFSHWLCLGFASVFAVQSVYMIGANFGAWPLTGVTLAPIAFGKAACFSAFVMVWISLGVSETAGESPAGHVPKKRVRTIGWVFAGLILLSLWSVGKALKIGVIDRDVNALAHYGPGRVMNSRIAAKLASLPRGSILARGMSSSYKNTKVLAGQDKNINTRIYTLGPAAWPVVGVTGPFGTTGGESLWRSYLTGTHALVQKGSVVENPQITLETALLSKWRAEHHPLWRASSEWDERLEPQDVQTTIISSLQLEAYRRLSDYLSGSLHRNGLRPRKGAILIVDVRTGEYLAKVQYPSVDPNMIRSGWIAWDRFVTSPNGYVDSNGQIIDLVDNTDRAPGSTAKLNTIMALLSSGQGKAKFYCAPGIKVNGHRINDFGDAAH
ncbi:MAG TPA: FtsW/RodA/SpoVE family cell cycle protein, partial [Armatimonadota bacterium]|nr:FtsW/RodA/SpoVE family cell cycle protein [Armatimonadota bacterium]